MQPSIKVALMKLVLVKVEKAPPNENELNTYIVKNSIVTRLSNGQNM